MKALFCYCLTCFSHNTVTFENLNTGYRRNNPVTTRQEVHVAIFQIEYENCKDEANGTYNELIPQCTSQKLSATSISERPTRVIVGTIVIGPM